MFQAHKLRDRAALDELLALAELRTERGLEVRPTPVMSADQGTSRSDEPSRFARVVREFMAAWKARGLPPTTPMVDIAAALAAARSAST